jgi:hypothetical protein
MLSRQDWSEHAWKAAAAEHGKKHSTWYAFRRLWAGPLAVAGALGALGYGCWWTWTHALPAARSMRVPPAWLILVLVAVVFISVRLLRRPLIPNRPARALKVIAVVGLWLGLLSFSVSYLAL